MDLLFTAYCAALFALPIVLYKLSLPSNHENEKQEKDWYYLLKRMLCQFKLTKFMNRPNALPFSHPKAAENALQEDTLSFHAIDLKSNSLYIHFSVGRMETEHADCETSAEIHLHLRLTNGRVFTLPEGVLLCILHGYEWRTKVLTITRQLDGNYRVVFNGFMKEITNKMNETNVEHVAFNCLFSRATDAMKYPGFFDRGLFGDAVCRAQWKDGKWTDRIGDQIGENHIGNLHGTFKSTNFGIDVILTMASLQTRRFGIADRHECSRSIEMFTLCDDGTVLCVENKRFAYNPPTQLIHGAVLHPNGTYTPITGCDLPLPEAHGTITPMTVHITTQAFQGTPSKEIKAYFAFNNQPEIIHMSTHWKTCLDVSCKLAVTTTSTGNGVTSILFLKRRPNVVYERNPELEFAAHVQSKMQKGERADNNDFIVFLDNPVAHNTFFTGGKGKFLTILGYLSTMLNYGIPPTFIITTTAMDAFMNAGGALSIEIRSAMRQLKTATSQADIEISCKNLQKLILATALPTKLREAILKSLTNHRMRGGPWAKANAYAVRSSGVTEDSVTTSSAGQNESFLGCKTDEDVLQAVQKCWASLYSFRSVEYRRNHGLDVETSMAIVVQKICDVTCAGVMFTCDHDGNPGRIRITSNFGLGESIVSGNEGGDVIHIHRTWKNALSLESEKANHKKSKVMLSPNGGTTTVYLSDSNEKELSIARQDSLQLARIGTRLEEILGMHLDIEWAYIQCHIAYPVILQARPVTFLQNWTEYELEHEFDVAVMSTQNVFTTANVKEVMPGAITPLSTSTIIRSVDRGVGNIVSGNYNSTEPSNSIQKYLVTMRHHVFIDFYNVLLSLPADKLNLETKSVDISVCGHCVTTPLMLKRAQHMHGKTTKLKKARAFWDILTCCWKVSPLMVAAKEIAAESVRTDDVCLSEFIKRIDHCLEKFMVVINAHSAASRASSCYQLIAINILTSEKSKEDEASRDTREEDELTPEMFAKIALLLSNGQAVISAEIPTQLEDIAAEIRKSSKRDEFVIGTFVQAQELLVQMPKVFKKFQNFLKEHGHRSSREFELMESSWLTNTTTLIKTLQTLSKLDKGAKKSPLLTTQQVVQQLNTNINRKFLTFLINKCRYGVVNREITKSEVVRYVNTLREAFAFLGDRLHKMQIIPRVDLVYFLTYDEIKHLAVQPNPELISKAMQRKRLYQSWNSLKFPEISSGMPKCIPTNVHEVISGGYELNGTPVCPGKISSRCCCMNDLNDIDQLQPGDVLITRGTDVAWTPYFPILSGVVTELGGLISHGAVVAREYGLPCLVGVEGALSMFKTGDRVVLDATNGKIYKGTEGLI